MLTNEGILLHSRFNVAWSTQPTIGSDTRGNNATQPGRRFLFSWPPFELEFCHWLKA